jgi:hypothetical protein
MKMMTKHNIGAANNVMIVGWVVVQCVFSITPNGTVQEL